ncbi:MAG: hypothetical protein KJ069_23075 [Anaerolineae bacterium]|nr:hypothetical protein [Anaerolineae bacterium]
MHIALRPSGVGVTVLHVYVNGLWVQQAGYWQPADSAALQVEILVRTGLPIALEGVYRRWLFCRRGWMTACRSPTVILEFLAMAR